MTSMSFWQYMYNIWLLPHSAPSWILSKAENLASPSLQDGATKWVYFLKENHQPTWPYGFSCLIILPDTLNCNVQCPTLFKTSDQMSPAFPNSQTYYQLSCQPSLTCISECGTSSWACFATFMNQEEKLIFLESIMVLLIWLAMR